MRAKTLMIQGTASHVGKSVLVTALCRAYKRKGLRVAPFKAQNMALNSFVTPDGKEIGWAQAVQAEAAGLMARVDFNPVLLKPTGDKTSQVIVEGKPVATLSARAYEKFKPKIWDTITAALNRLCDEFDLIVIEGAGSPAEINLKKNDIVNMRVATYARSPVLLVSDIDRGGVFASLLGTLDLLSASERRLVSGLVINKFRGDLGILRPGLRALTARTHKPVLGVLPYFTFEYQDQEDSVGLDQFGGWAPNSAGKLRVAVVRNPRISNFTDFDSLRQEPCVDFAFVEKPGEIEDADLMILPGSKNTMEDLHALNQSGLANSIREAARNGVFVLGICGGYQMLGNSLKDTHGVESSRRSIRGLGLLDLQTVFHQEKSLHQVHFAARGIPGLLAGYEIHMGQTRRGKDCSPLFHIVTRSGNPVQDEDGAISSRGNVLGSYIHGLLTNDSFRHALLKKVAARRGLRLLASSLQRNFAALRQKNFDRLADWVTENLDMNAINRIIGLPR